MPQYNAPLNDISFVLHEVLKVTEQDIPGFDELEPELTSAILEEAGKLAANAYAPINLSGDQQGCKLVAGKVVVPDGFTEAYQELCEGVGQHWINLKSLVVRIYLFALRSRFRNYLLRLTTLCLCTPA
jgi:hypothetical protein